MRKFLRSPVDLEFGKFRRFISKSFDKDELRQTPVSEIPPFSPRYIEVNLWLHRHRMKLLVVNGIMTPRAT